MQERRRGPSHHWTGPRLPDGPRDHLNDEEIADPAEGRKVARCLACGSPQELTVFQLVLSGKHAGWIRLCSRDYYHANPIDPQFGDPLQAA